MATTASLLLALDTTSPTDIDASTLPKETIVELTSSSDASKSSLVIVNVDGSKSDGGKDIEEIKPKSAIASEVSSESSLNSDIAVVDEKKDSEVVNDGSSDSSTTTTESAAAAVAEVSAEKESSSSTSANKKDEKSVAQPAVVSEEYKTMKSIIDNYKSSKKSSSSSTTTSSSSSSKNEVVTSVVSSDLTAIAVPGLLISSIVGVASSFLNNGDDDLGGGEGDGGGVAAMDDKKKASSTEWKMEQPTHTGYRIPHQSIIHLDNKFKLLKRRNLLSLLVQLSRDRVKASILVRLHHLHPHHCQNQQIKSRHQKVLVWQTLSRKRRTYVTFIFTSLTWLPCPLRSLGFAIGPWSTLYDSEYFRLDDEDDDDDDSDMEENDTNVENGGGVYWWRRSVVNT